MNCYYESLYKGLSPPILLPPPPASSFYSSSFSSFSSSSSSSNSSFSFLFFLFLFLPPPLPLLPSHCIFFIIFFPSLSHPHHLPFYSSTSFLKVEVFRLISVSTKMFTQPSFPVAGLHTRKPFQSPEGYSRAACSKKHTSSKHCLINARYPFHSWVDLGNME